LSGPELLHLNPLYKPKTLLNKPNFQTHLLKTHTFLAFDGFTLGHAADLILNSTVSSQIVYLYLNPLARQLVLCGIHFKMAKRRADEMIVLSQ